MLLLSSRARARTLAVTVLSLWLAALYALSIGPAFAADGTTTDNAVQVLAMVNLVVSFVLPLFLQVITNSQAPEPVKAIITLAASAIVGALTPFLTGVMTWPPSDWWALVLSAASVFLTSILAHYGLWKPTGLTGSDGKIANALPGGLGGTGAAPADPAPAAPDVTLGAEANPNIDVVVAPNPAAGLADNAHVQDDGGDTPPPTAAGDPNQPPSQP